DPVAVWREQARRRAGAARAGGWAVLVDPATAGGLRAGRSRHAAADPATDPTPGYRARQRRKPVLAHFRRGPGAGGGGDAASRRTGRPDLRGSRRDL